MSALKRIGFFTAFIIPGLVILGYYLGGWWNFLTMIQVFIIIPLIDHLVGTNTSNVPEEKVKIISKEFYYRLITFIWTYFQLGFIFWGCYVIAFGHINTWYEWIGFTFGFGLVTGGIGITVAHELGHKKETIERLYCKILLMTVCYMHFYIEHNRGHHVRVATPSDPATAFRNETFYAFWVKSVFKGYQHAWNLEKERMKKKGKKAYDLHNQMIWFTLLPLFFIFILTFLFSLSSGSIAWNVPIFLCCQSFLALSLLELVNYVEHYGIQRKEISQGHYEQVAPIHSWNASHLISNFFLFQLQRHSDHHASAIKRYQVLDHYDQSPQLPAGYPTMIIIALIPPLWFWIMNRRLEKWHGGQSVAIG